MISVEHTTGSAVCVARVVGDLDTVSAPELRASVDAAVSDGCRVVICDLSGVKYMDSSALGFIVWADRRLNPVSGRLVLAGADRNVSRIIELSGLVGAAPSVSSATSVADAVAAADLADVRTTPRKVESFTFSADAANMASVRARIGDIVAPLGLSGSAQFDLKVAVGEALANAVRHGSPRGVSDAVGVEVSLFDDRVAVTITDSGHGFSGEAAVGSDLYAANGRGVLFMRALADHVEFGPAEGGGTRVRLVKRISANDTPDA